MPARSLLMLCVVLLVSGCGAPAAEKVDPLAQYEGGTPVAEQAGTVGFLWMGKQSVMCVGDAFERQVAYVDFSVEGGNPILGTATLAADGTGSAEFAVPVKTLRTGHADRDTKLMNSEWLDAENHKEMTLKTTSLERVRPTVWKVKGDWTMRGVTKPVEFYANVRYLEEMRNVGRDVVRLKGAFDINLKDHEVGGGKVGNDAVAEVWTVQVVAIGPMSKE